MPNPGSLNLSPDQGLRDNFRAASTPSYGSFGYMQNPVMQGAGMPAARPMNPAGRPYKPYPMYQPAQVSGNAKKVSTEY